MTKRMSGILMLVLAGLVGFVGTAYALPPAAGTVFFFSDNTYTVQVGYTWWTCSGVTHSGQTTSYSLVDNPFEKCSGGHGTGGDVVCTYMNGVLWCF